MELLLPRGVVTLIDDEDAAVADVCRWNAHEYDAGRFYVSGSLNQHTVYLHRYLLSAPKGITVDHINLDTLDNQRSNLRLASRSQQNMNRGVIGAKSGFKGVHWMNGRTTRPWRAVIHLLGKQMHIGYFASPEEAARAYDAKALELFGEFARCNFDAA